MSDRCCTCTAAITDIVVGHGPDGCGGVGGGGGGIGSGKLNERPTDRQWCGRGGRVRMCIDWDCCLVILILDLFENYHTPIVVL